MKNKLLIIVAFIFSLVGLIYARHLVLKSGFQLHDLEIRQKIVQEENLKLDDELNRLTSPQRLKSLAKQFNFQERKIEQVLFLEKDVKEAPDAEKNK